LKVHVFKISQKSNTLNKAKILNLLEKNNLKFFLVVSRTPSELNQFIISGREKL